VSDLLLAELALAYQRQQLVPIRRCFFHRENGVDYACPIVCLALFHRVADKDDPGIELDRGSNICLEWGSTNLGGEEFVWGLISAWDGQEKVKDDEEYLAGYALGLEAAQQLCPRDPPV